MPLHYIELPPSIDPIPADVIALHPRGGPAHRDLSRSCPRAGVRPERLRRGLFHVAGVVRIRVRPRAAVLRMGQRLRRHRVPRRHARLRRGRHRDRARRSCRKPSKLAGDFDLPVEFVAGSYVPHGADDRVHSGGSYSWFTPDSDYAYDDLGLEPRDMDVLFVYPWPDEEPVTLDLFEKYCGHGAVLVSYHGGDEFRLRRNRKPGKKRRRE